MNIDKYKNMRFFDADAGGGDGGGDLGGGDGGTSAGAAVFEPSPKGAQDRPLPTKGGESSGSKGAETSPASGGAAAPLAPVATPAFDPNKFAQEFASTLAPILQKKDEPQLTPEQLAEKNKVWTPNEEWFKSFDNLETRNAAILQMRDALMDQAGAAFQAKLEELTQQIHGTYAPHIQRFIEAEDRARESRFGKEYPVLDKPEMQPLIKAIVQDLTDRKQRFGSEKELFKAIADGVTAVIKVNNPDFTLEAATNGSGQQKEQGRSGRQLPVSTPGGGGSTGRRESSDGAPVKKGLAVFQK